LYSKNDIKSKPSTFESLISELNSKKGGK